MSLRPISEDDLQAYVDQALDGQRGAEVAAYLARHPDIAERVAEQAHHRQLLRNALEPVAHEPLPPELNLAHMIGERADRRARKRASPAWRAAAAGLLLTVGAAGGWSLHGAFARPSAGIASLAQEAVDSYAVYAPDADHPVEIHAADSRQLVGWGAARLGRPVSVPDLSASGFRFMGGRLVATPHGPALLYMFDNRDGVRLVMMARNMAIDRDAPMSWRPKGSVGSISWASRGLGFSIVAPLTSPSLRSIASTARVQLSNII